MCDFSTGQRIKISFMEKFPLEIYWGNQEGYWYSAIGVPQFYNRYLDNTPGHDSEFIGELVGSTPPAGENFKDIKITPPNILKKETIQRIECHSSNNKQFTNITPGYDQNPEIQKFILGKM